MLKKLPKYRKKAGRNLAVVRIDGKDHYLGPYDSPESRAEYERLIGEYLAQGRTCTNGKGAVVTVAALSHAYGALRWLLRSNNGRCHRGLAQAHS